MPEAVCPGSAHGDAPKVSDRLKIFFPEDRGVRVPENLQSRDVVVLNRPLDAMSTETDSPASAVKDQLPVTADGEAGVL